MNIPLSLDQVSNLSHRQVILVSAETKFLLFPTFQQACRDKKSKYILIHYQTSDNKKTIEGHWAAMIIKPKIKQIWYFDSYGYFPDDQLSKIPIFYRNKTGQDHRDIGVFLFIAIRMHKFKVHYNDIQLQNFNSSITTCGRYCGLFLRKGWAPERFVDSILDYSNFYNISPDKAIVQLTS